MTRAHALRELLNHGPLTMAAMLEITGWRYAQLRKTVSGLRDSGAIHFCPFMGAYTLSQNPS